MPPSLHRRRLRWAGAAVARDFAAATPAAHRCQICRQGRLLRLLPRRQQLPGTALAMSCCWVGQGWVTEARSGRRCCWRRTALAGLIVGMCSNHGADGTGCEIALSPCGDLATLFGALWLLPISLRCARRSSSVYHPVVRQGRLLTMLDRNIFKVPSAVGCIGPAVVC